MRSLARTVGLLFGRRGIDDALAGRLAAWQQTPRADLTRPHARTRYVVVDVETTGLDLRQDNVIAVGALAVDGGMIAFADVFDEVLRQERASADENILIHGIGGETQLTGRDPALVMLEFVEYAGNSPLVAFRADFDRVMLERATRRLLGVGLRLPFIDLAFLLPALFRGTSCDSLDEWVAHFGGGGEARHLALGDAYATAQLFLVVLAEADRVGMRSAGELIAAQKAQRWLGTRR